MTDLLDAQSEIRSRNKVIRDKSGQFRRPDTIIQVQLAAERMKVRLKRDVKAAEHARGVVWEDSHFHALPGAKLHTVESSIRHIGERSDRLPDLLDLVAA